MDIQYKNIVTEGIKYTGSKKLIIPKILELIQPLQIKTILDGFAGTTRVGQTLKQFGYSVDSNDLAEYSKIFGLCYLVHNDKQIEYKIKNYIAHLNNLVGIDGFFTEYYGGDDNNGSSIQEDGKKRIWQKHNTRKLDAIRNEIDIITSNEIEKSILLTSLMLALDKVDSSLGHQVSYLRQWSQRSYNFLKLEIPHLLYGNKKYNIFQQDVKTIDKIYDAVYFDPPYGTNNQVMPTSRVRYASYYHIWTTICKNDKPIVIGKANRREDASSDTQECLNIYESTNYEVVKKEIELLFTSAKSKYILFSYNNKGKVSIDDIRQICNKYTLIQEISFSYKENVMKNLTSTKQWLSDQSDNNEFLFLIKK